jgi:hypothetical protein
MARKRELNQALAKRLRRIVARKKGKSPMDRKRKRIKTIDPKDFEGTWNQTLRRRKVFEMRMLNKTVREMGAEIGSSSATIITDLKAIDAALRKTIDRTQADAILNERLSNLEALRDIALRGVETRHGNEQIGYLNTAMKLEEQITKLLQDAGVLKRITGRLELTGQDEPPIPLHIYLKSNKTITELTDFPVLKEVEKPQPGYDDDVVEDCEETFDSGQRRRAR